MRIHRPVLLKEAVALLNCRSGGLYVDCTAGMAGHSEEILKASAPDGHLLAMDRDEKPLRIVRQKLATFQNRVITVVHSDYRRYWNSVGRRAHVGSQMEFWLILEFRCCSSPTPDADLVFKKRVHWTCAWIGARKRLHEDLDHID